MSKIPKWLLKNVGCKTQREFKQVKRYEVYQASKAIEDARLGCAYTPAAKELKAAQEALDAAQEKLSVKNWGR